jgi:hypothetical protein
VSELDVMDSANMRAARSSAERTLRQRLNGKHAMSLPEIALMWGGEFGLKDDERAELLRHLTERNGTKR